MSASDSSDSETMAITSSAAIGRSRPSAGAKDIQCTVCDRFYDIGRMVNIGDKNYAIYRDKHCHKAVRMVERAAETKGETVKTNLSTMKKHNKSDWKRLVASVRLNFEDDPQSVWDLPSTSLEAHEAGRGEYYSETASTTMIDTEVRVALLTKRQFKAHMVYQEMYGRDEAESMWRLACSSTDVYKETAEDGSVSIAVRLPKVWTSCARMEKSRRVVDIAEISQTMERAKKLFATPDCSPEISNEMGLSLLQHGRHFITPDPDEKEKASKTTPGADDRSVPFLH